MKKLAIIAVAALLFGGCTTHDSRRNDMNGPEPRTSMKRVERNAGEMMEEANHGIKKGVDAVDRTWETPAEQQRKSMNPDYDRSTSPRDMDR